MQGNFHINAIEISSETFSKMSLNGFQARDSGMQDAGEFLYRCHRILSKTFFFSKMSLFGFLARDYGSPDAGEFSHKCH